MEPFRKFMEQNHPIADNLLAELTVLRSRYPSRRDDELLMAMLIKRNHNAEGEL